MLELADDRLIRLLQHVRQYIQSAAVCHADHDTGDALTACHIQQPVQHRHHHVRTFNRKTLLSQIRLVQEALEPLNFRQTLQHLALLLGIQRLQIALRFCRLTQPVALRRVLDMQELISHCAGVDAAQILDCLQRCGRPVFRIPDLHHAGR